MLQLTIEQKKIVDDWLDKFGKMYNIALKYIKNTIETDKSCLNFMKTKYNLNGNVLVNNQTMDINNLCNQDIRNLIINTKNMGWLNKLMKQQAMSLYNHVFVI